MSLKLLQKKKISFLKSRRKPSVAFVKQPHAAVPHEVGVLPVASAVGVHLSVPAVRSIRGRQQLQRLQFPAAGGGLPCLRWVDILRTQRSHQSHNIRSCSWLFMHLGVHRFGKLYLLGTNIELFSSHDDNTYVAIVDCRSYIDWCSL